jgi:L-lactate dehydrogenase complex protein LldF
VAAGRDATLGWLPGIAGGWTDQRDVPAPPRQSFRNWWRGNAEHTEERVARDGGRRDVAAEDETTTTDGQEQR